MSSTEQHVPTRVLAFGGNAMAAPLSNIEPFEEKTAVRLIEDSFEQLTGKRDLPKPAGYMVCVKIYVRPELLKMVKRPDGTEAPLYISQHTQSNDKYDSVAALVVAVGPQAYKGKTADGSDRYPEGPWCKTGDWVLIPRYDGFPFMWRSKVAMMLLPDDKILGIITDPADVMATYQSDRV